MSIKYRISKVQSGVVGEQILLYPLVQGDQIYEYNTYEECHQKLIEIQGLDIYKNIALEIREVIYG